MTMMESNRYMKYTVFGINMFYIITLIIGFVPVTLIFLGYKIAELVL
jgi:hypothetical protein